MRDLERLHDVVEYRVNPGQLKVVFLGVLAVACAIFAVGVTVGKRLEGSTPALTTDPLAELDRATAPAGREGGRRGHEERSEAPALTYHDELTERGGEDEDGDEAAAAAPRPERSPAAPSSSPTPPRAAPVAAPEPEEPVRDEPALEEEPGPGESAVYTLQVASFETREEAHQFAADLRTRGHRTFVVRTSTEERGTWYRIRVGPFDSRREATSYQRRFERTERLPTFLVRRSR